MIALAPGVRTTLSGPETKSMTQYLRLHHDAILVGVGTAIVDDPALNCRYPSANLTTQPQPIIVDPEIRWSAARSKVRQLAKENKGKMPWSIHALPDVNPGFYPSENCNMLFVRYDDSFTTATASKKRKIDWKDILEALKQ